MGWIIRLKRKQLVGGTGEDDIYPITSTGAVYNEAGKDLDTILRELQEAQYTKVLQEVIKNGNVLHFSYTDETTKDIQLPNAFTDVELTTSGNDNTVTFTFADGTSKSIVITASEQEQADWAETDNTKNSYIKNKPAIPVVDGVDIDVTSWGTEDDLNYWTSNNSNITPNKKSLLYAVGMSLYYHDTGVYTRIHIKQDFSITTETALNTSNCEIIGHSRTLNMDNHPINLTGRYFKVTDLRLQRVADYGNDDGNTINTACICQDMDTVSYIVFDNVTFFNWALVAKTDIVNDVMYPRTFNLVKVSNVGDSKSLHIICRDCQFPIRPTRFGDTYKNAIMNADYSNTFIKVDIPSNQIGAFSIETTGNVGGVHGTSKSIIGAQKFYVHLASAVKEDMYLFSDGTVDYRYSIGTDTISQNPTPNGYYPNDRCRVWWRINNEQIAGGITPSPSPIGSLPVGVILLWSGAVNTIPSGWVLCDGQNGTPNLSNKFVIGTWQIAENAYNVGATGGSASVTLTENQIPSHTHTISSDGAHTHGFVGDRRLTSVADYTIYDQTPVPYDTQSDTDAGGHYYSTTSDGSHTHTIGSTGGNSPHSNMPPYYALAYIMYVGQ